jgi:hypothetical protein
MDQDFTTYVGNTSKVRCRCTWFNVSADVCLHVRLHVWQQQEAHPYQFVQFAQSMTAHSHLTALAVLSRLGAAALCDNAHNPQQC